MSAYSYYVPALRFSFGPEAVRCKAKWDAVGLANAGRYDGVSLMPDGTFRFVAQDFFSEAFRVKVYDSKNEPE